MQNQFAKFRRVKTAVFEKDEFFQEKIPVVHLTYRGEEGVAFFSALLEFEGVLNTT